MGLKEQIKKVAKKAVVIGSVAAATTFVPKAEASQSTDIDVAQLKDVPEFVVGGVTEQAEIAQPDKVEAHSFLEQIKKGEKIEYNGMTFDVPKLNASKDKTLKNFGFTFEGDQVGIQIHDDGKKFWGKDDPEKTYKILMSAHDFEGLMNTLMDKDLGQASARPDDPHDWVYRDSFPNFYTIENGVQRNMTEAEAGKAFDKLVDVVCAMNSEGVLDASVILNKYKKQIEKADFGWILARAVNAPTGIQNALLAKGLKDYKTPFADMAVNTDAKRKIAQKDFEFNKSVAIRRWERDKQEQAEIEQIRAERLAKGLPVSSPTTADAKPAKKSAPTTIIIAGGNTTYR